MISFSGERLTDLAQSATEAAAFAAMPHYGMHYAEGMTSDERTDAKNIADGAAVDAMGLVLARNTLVKLRSTNCEGIKDGAPHFEVGAMFGSNDQAPLLEFAADPIDGTTNTLKGSGDAVSLLAIAEPSQLMQWQGIKYMMRYAVAPGPGSEFMHAEGTKLLDWDVRRVFQGLAEALSIKPSDLCISVLKRPRNERIIAALEALGANPNLITDGDVAPVLALGRANSELHGSFGAGGSPEATIGALGIRLMGGSMVAKWHIDGEKLHVDQQEFYMRQRFNETDLSGTGLGVVSMTAIVDHSVTGHKAGETLLISGRPLAQAIV